MKKIAALVAVVASTFVVIACTQETKHPPVTSGDGDSGAPLGPTGGGTTPRDSGADGATLDAGDAAAICSTLTVGTAVERVAIPNNLPAATGGTLVDGTYRLTDFSVYTGAGGTTGPTGATLAATISLNAGTIEQVVKTNQSSAVTFSGTYTASGTDLTITGVCPTATAAVTHPFSAAGTTITIINTSSNEVSIYTKQ